MSNFKVGDKVRFKGSGTTFRPIQEILPNGQIGLREFDGASLFYFPANSFTKRVCKTKNRVLVSFAIKPETLSKIRLESQQSGLSHGKVIDSKFTEGGGK